MPSIEKTAGGKEVLTRFKRITLREFVAEQVNDPKGEGPKIGDSFPVIVESGFYDNVAATI